MAAMAPRVEVALIYIFIWFGILWIDGSYG
jgi:hypothetical protein